MKANVLVAASLVVVVAAGVGHPVSSSGSSSERDTETVCFNVANLWASLEISGEYTFTFDTFSKTYAVHPEPLNIAFKEMDTMEQWPSSEPTLGLERFVGVPESAWPTNPVKEHQRISLAGNEDHVVAFVLEGLTTYEMVPSFPATYDASGGRCHVKQAVDGVYDAAGHYFDDAGAQHDDDEECFGWDIPECFNGGAAYDTTEGHVDFEFIMHGDTAYCESKGRAYSGFPPQASDRSWVTDYHEVFSIVKGIFHSETVVNLGGSGTSGHCYFGSASPFNETITNSTQILPDYGNNTVGYGNKPWPNQVYHMFSGRDFDGNNIGRGYCGKGIGVSDQRFTNNTTTRALVVVHEIGHNFRAGHEDATCNSESQPGAKADTVSGGAVQNRVLGFTAFEAGVTVMWSGLRSDTLPYFSDVIRNDDPGKSNLKQVNDDATKKYWESVYCTAGSSGTCD